MAGFWSGDEGFASTESGFWGGTPSTPEPFGPVRAVTTTQLLEMDGIAIRSCTFRYDVLDQALARLGTLDVAGAPKVANDTSRTIKRTLDGLTVDPIAAAELDAISARLRPTVILEDGSEWPLGVFLFVDATRQALTVGREFSGSLHDQLFMADQPTDQTVSYRRGKNLGDILQEQAEQAGFPVISVDATNRVTSKPVAWPAGTHRLKIMEEVATMAAMHSPYCTNDGVFRCQKISAGSDVVLRYEDGGRIVADSAAESDDLLDAPNRFIVIDDSATDEPIVGTYDVPRSSPVSIARRGFPVAQVRTLQGLDGPDAANEAAAADATSAGLGFEIVSFDAIPDYRHDTYDEITYLGETWAETSWELECSPTAVMHHEARKVYA
jgi:hypothetical protein